MSILITHDLRGPLTIQPISAPWSNTLLGALCWLAGWHTRDSPSSAGAKKGIWKCLRPCRIRVFGDVGTSASFGPGVLDDGLIPNVTCVSHEPSSSPTDTSALAHTLAKQTHLNFCDSHFILLDTHSPHVPGCLDMVRQ